ncbi:MAG: hypothetical protein Q8P18_19935, partial [Pseudomonadota bacterium]|nr:hypothetical protein [Pseudomonadota bacterium]
LVRAARGGTLRLRLRGARGQADVRVRVPAACGRIGLARLIEGVVRREGAGVGAIEALSIRTVPMAVERQGAVPAAAPRAVAPVAPVTRWPAQLALLPRVR